MLLEERHKQTILDLAKKINGSRITAAYNAELGHEKAYIKYETAASNYLDELIEYVNNL